MAESRRSGEQSGIIVKNRSSSGCLIVRKKNGDVSAAGSSGSRKVFRSKKEKKRPRMELSDSGSIDELLMPPRRRVGPETLMGCNGLSILEKGVLEESELGRKRDRVERVRHNENGLIDRTEGQSDRKRDRLDVFEFDEYDGIDEEMMMRRKHLGDSRMDTGGRRFLGSMSAGRCGIEREFESGSSRQVVDKRKNLYFERTSSFNQGGMNRFGMDRDAGHVPISLLREKYIGDSDEPIRLQGKNGVLKVMVKKKKKVGDPLINYDRLDVEEKRSSSRIEDNVKRNAPTCPPSYLETDVLEKPGSFVRKEKTKLNSRKSVSNKKNKDVDSDSDDSDTALKLGPKRMGSCKSVKEVSSENEKTPGGKLTSTRIKEGKVRRGSGTEKQKLRERIRGMLIESGWTIDYRPRRNRDYLDAVYINPNGTAYWSIIKAYDALLKQLNDEEDEPKQIVDGSPFTPLSDEVLGQLTRKTRKKIEKEMKKKQRDGSQGLSTREATSRRNLGAIHNEDSMDSSNHEEKLSSFLKHGGKSAKGRMNENGVVSQSSKGQSSTHHLHDSDGKPSSGSNSHPLQGRKGRKLGRCTLLVRSSNEGSNSETDGFVPYAGKRTLLSWLIDSGTVQLSAKVQYMNRRRTKVMLEGWITRDGIHCGCCSKILTVSKFEIHAGSKLRQPFQNIYLDSGVSLLQCQIDAWNRQEGSERIGFDTVDIDGDDPNDDTCGICGDGGDLICCDGCPSTFHQSCLGIQMLPPGDWHCPNCICKFCGVAGGATAQEGDTTAHALLTCCICEKKCHKLCVQEMHALSVDSVSPFCGQKCGELFEHLQKYLAVKHELEAGFSWCLIRRTEEDSDTSLRGLPQRVECNSKLAVALTVMDECFLPIVDRRSGINLIHNVLYNSGSNFNRLNYTGFYTAILEKGDEIISAASIRFHGTQLAEMPFIGTRHIYRRQGMCRRLFCALESALRSLKVEKLIIPAISELMHTWTTVFGFTPLEESLKREMRSLNMLVFPGVDMLQKVLLEHEGIKENITASTGSEQVELKVNHEIAPEVPNKSDVDSSAEHNSHRCAGSDFLYPNVTDGGVAATDFESKCPGVSSNSTSMLSGSSPSHASNQGACADSQSGDKTVECASDVKSLSNSDTSHDALEKGNKVESDSPVRGNSHFSADCDMDNAGDVTATVAVSRGVKITVSVEETSDSQSVESASKRNSRTIPATSNNAMDIEDKPVLDSIVEDHAQSFKGGDVDDARSIDVNIAAAYEVETAVSFEGTACSDSQLGSKLVETAQVESKAVAESSVKDNAQSCEEVDVEDVHAIDVNVATADEVKMPEDSMQSCREGDIDEPKIPTVDIVCSLELGEKSVECTSERKCLIAETVDPVPVKQKPLAGSSSQNNSPCKVGDSEDNFAQAEAAPSPGENAAEYNTRTINENPVVPLSTLDGYDASSSMQMTADFNHEIMQNLDGSSGSGTRAAHCEESSLQTSL